MQEHIQRFVVVSIAYVIAFSLTLGFVFPLQTMLFSGSKLEIGLLFLPHGVRILAFYFFGWKAIFYLMPSSYLFWTLSNYAGSELHVLSPLVSMIACYVGYKIATLLPLPASRELTPNLWKFLVFSGAISSFVNGIALSALQHQGTELMSVLGYLVGDIMGLIVCFLMLMYAFRWARLIGSASDV